MTCRATGQYNILVRLIVWFHPQATFIICCCSPKTGTGTLTLVKFPIPSCPFPFHPHTYTVPLPVCEQVISYTIPMCFG